MCITMDMKMGLVTVLILTKSWFSDARQLPGNILQGEALRNDNACTLCEEFATQALDYLGENKTQTEILDLLHNSCSHVPSLKQECITMVDYYVPLFFLQLSSIEPGSFCRKVNLCEDVATISSQFQENSCDLCHRTVSEILEKLKDPDTQMDVIQILLKACNSMEKYAKKCKRMVFEYGPLVLANAEQFLETTDICMALHACTASTAINGEVLGTGAVSAVSSS